MAISPRFGNSMFKTIKPFSVKIKSKKALRRFACMLILTVCSTPSSAQAAAVNSAKIIQILDGPSVFIENRQAKVNDVARKGQRIRTGRSRAEIRFNTGAVGRLAQNSSLLIGECARLQHGLMLVNGSINGCSYSVVAGVRGTTYLFEVDGRGASTVRVLEGEVMVMRATQTSADGVPIPDTDPPQVVQSSTGLAPISLQAGEEVTLSPAGYPQPVERLEQPEFSRLMTGKMVNGYEQPLPGEEKIQKSYKARFPDQPAPKARRCGSWVPAAVKVRFPSAYEFLRSNDCGE